MSEVSNSEKNSLKRALSNLDQQLLNIYITLFYSVIY